VAGDAASTWAERHKGFQASRFSSAAQLRTNASRAGRSGSDLHAGSADQSAAWSLPRETGVGGAGAGQEGCTTGGHASGSTADDFGAAGGVAAQPPSNAMPNAAMADNASSRLAKENGVEWVFLEILAALAIAVAIVWWTLPKKRKPDDRRER
jgi:hypothetical protein